MSWGRPVGRRLSIFRLSSCASRQAGSVQNWFFSLTQPAAIDVDYALWLFHKAMSLGAITVEWKSTCRRFGILFGFQTLFLLASCASPFFSCSWFCRLEHSGHKQQPPKKDIQLVYEFEKELNNSTMFRQSEASILAHVCVFLYPHHIWRFFIVRAMKTLLYVAQKESSVP